MWGPKIFDHSNTMSKIQDSYLYRIPETLVKSYEMIVNISIVYVSAAAYNNI